MPSKDFTPQPKKKTRGRSFRINEEWLKVLNEEAAIQGISVNALMNKVLQQYSVQGRHLKHFGAVILSRTMCSKILDCCTDDEIKKIAEFIGSTETIDSLQTMGISPTYEKVIQHLKIFGTFGGWFNFNRNTKNSGEYIHLRHGLGKKWSIFLAETFSTVFKTILHKEVKIETSDNSVTVDI
jgi:hypothetical protein